MSRKVIVNETAVRALVREALDGGIDIVNVNAVVDPSAAVTDPMNPRYSPTSTVELGTALDAMISDIDDEQIPTVYDAVKIAISPDHNEEKTGDVKMSKNTDDQLAMETRIRAEVTKMLEAMKPKVDPADIEADEDEDEERKRANTVADVGGATFQEIANELGFAVSGAKRAVDWALKKASFVALMDQDELEIMTLTTMNDFIEYLAGSGEITGADVQLLKDHPEIVRELDGFREYLDKTVRKVRKATDKDAEDGSEF